jgi:hypothetical protein
MNDLTSEACTGDETYKVVSTMTEEAKKVVAAMNCTAPAAMHHAENDSILQTGPMQHDNVQQQQSEAPDDPDSSMLHNPTRIKPKGCPSEKEKKEGNL